MTTDGPIENRPAENRPAENRPAENGPAENRTAEWVDAQVSEIRRTQADEPTKRKHIMILSERGGERWLPIWIGPTEATALALILESAETPRPFTYQLAASLVAATGSGIAEVRITRLVAPIFYASVLVNCPAGVEEVDSRPSDAVNLALVTGAPIRIDSDLFGPGLPASHEEEVLACSVATADIAAEAQQFMRESLRRFQLVANPRNPRASPPGYIRSFPIGTKSAFPR